MFARPEKTRRRAVVSRLIEIVTIIILAGGIIFGQQKIHSFRAEYLQMEAYRVQQPVTQAHVDEAKQQLQAAQQNLGEIVSSILYRDTIDKYLDFLESRGKAHRIDVSIDKVEQEVQVTDRGDKPLLEVQKSEAYSLVRVSIIVSGSTSNLFEYLHDVEHGPFLSAVPSWEVRTNTQHRAVVGVTLPNGIGAAPGSAGQIESTPNQLAADIILVVRENEKAI